MQRFCLSVDCLFILLIVPFQEQKFLTLMKSNLTIIFTNCAFGDVSKKTSPNPRSYWFSHNFILERKKCMYSCNFHLFVNLYFLIFLHCKLIIYFIINLKISQGWQHNAFLNFTYNTLWPRKQLYCSGFHSLCLWMSIGTESQSSSPVLNI